MNLPNYLTPLELPPVWRLVALVDGTYRLELVVDREILRCEAYQSRAEAVVRLGALRADVRPRCGRPFLRRLTASG